MRTSKYLLYTLKEVPADTEIISHQLMLRAGMIRKLASGLYTWLPTGLRVLKKIENIVREEMKNIDAIEILMPIVQPANLWRKSGRLERYGPELLRFIDRSKRLFILGPTHEEVIIDLIRNELSSYKQLPLIFFQIHTKFRDEIRPCFGIVRSREFLMKDAYSFHTSQESLQETYNKMYEVYTKIFTSIGLNFRIIQADNGPIGGNISHEFQIITKDIKNHIVLHNNSNDMANTELSKYLVPTTSHNIAIEEKMRLVDTPNVSTITDLIKQFNLPIERIVKTFLVKSSEKSKYPLVALLIRGDHKLNKIKIQKLSQIAYPLTFASEIETRSIINVCPNFLGPVNMPIPMIIDHTVSVMSNFIAGANINGKYFFGINWNHDVDMPVIADISNMHITDKVHHYRCNNKNHSTIERSIEIGHIFQLGTEYSEIMNVAVQNKFGDNQTLTMGCYGIGLTRLVAAVIEQNYDKHGIIWPDNIAPFQIAILPINMHKSYCVQNFAEKLYADLCKKGAEVLIDDRKERYGMMFTDIELIGIPHTIVISDYSLYNNNIEYYNRRNGKKQLINVNDIDAFLVKIIK